MFPELRHNNKTVLVLKKPKTATSTRKVFLPKTVAEMLVEWRQGQEFTKEALGKEYQDFNLVMANGLGMPSGRKKLIVKRIPRDYSFSNMLETGQVTIKNASGTWMKSPDGIDLMACKMLFKFFREYQETGVIQEHIGYFC